MTEGDVQDNGLEVALFNFLCRKYVQRSDDRQKAMGLQYMTAETHGLAEDLARFFRTYSGSVA
jgi:hypothetical protein